MTTPTNTISARAIPSTALAAELVIPSLIRLPNVSRETNTTYYDFFARR